MLEGGNVVPELRELVLKKASGNPLFMEEFTHTLLENGSIQKKDGQFVLARKTEDIQVPDTIQGIIAARMDRLEDNLKRTMQVASVIGRDFAFRILQTITGMREDLKSCLLNLQGLEFIYEKSLFPELEYIFKHALIQEVAYNSLLQARRKEIHESIGDAIESLYASRLDEFYEMLAYHFSKSDNHEKAYQFLKLSGQKAVNDYSNQEAVNYYKEALDKLKKLPETQENIKKQIEVINLMINPLGLLLCPEGTLEIFQEGLRLSEGCKDERSALLFDNAISIYYSFMGDTFSARKYSERLFQKAQKFKDIELITKTTFSLLLSYTESSEYNKITEIAPGVITLLEETNKQSEYFSLPMNAYSAICMILGNSLGWIGQFDEGEKYLNKGLQYATEINDKINLGWCESNYGTFYRSKGEGQNVILHYKNCAEYFDEAKFQDTHGYINLGLCYGYFLANDLKNAKERLAKGRKIVENLHINNYLSLASMLSSFVHFAFGEFAEAKNCAEKAIELSKQGGQKQYEELSEIWLGRILGAKDTSQFVLAQQHIEQGMKIAEKLNHNPVLAQGYFFLGELYANTDRKEEALKNLNKAMAMHKEMEIGFWPDKIQEVLDRL